jgi:hypothetical protein
MTDTTPRPWGLFEVDGDGFAITSQVVHTNSKGGTWKEYVAQMIPNSADAALIVTAVNAHDDLVKALEDFTNTYSEELQEHGYSLEEADEHDLIARARSALAKAKGEKT